MKKSGAACLLLVALFCVYLETCARKAALFPFPRVGRRSDATFARVQRVFGLLKQPRVGRSDPLYAEAANERRLQDIDEDAWFDSNADYGRYNPMYGEKEVSAGNGENYVSAQRRTGIAPWAFFLITPNFQNTADQQDLIPQFGNESDDVKDD